VLGLPAWTLYMDESGSAGDREGHYVLGCLAGDEEAIARLTDRLYYLKRGMATGTDPDSWEVHASRIMSRRSPIRTRTEQKKLDALEALVNTICESDVTLFGVALTNKTAPDDEKDEAHYALTFILERYGLFLCSMGHGAVGRVVSDMMRRGASKKANRIFASTIRGHNPLSHTQTRRITSIEYVDSASSPATQMADVIAYVIRKHVEGDGRFATMFAKLMNKMWRGGEWHGWKRFSVVAGKRRP